MAITFAENVATTNAKLLGVIKEKILASSDWAHLAVAASVTVATSTIAAGATSGTASGSVATGAVMTFWRANTDNGASVPEVRVNTGGGTSSISWTDALTAPNGTYQVGDHIGIGSFVKATTTRGAQMVVDFADAAISTVRLQMKIYRTHDGTTGVDGVNRYITWKSGAGATSDKAYVRVSAGKEHLYVDVEGPKGGETNAEQATYGSQRQCLALCDISPYYSTTYDNVPAVCLIGAQASGTFASPLTTLTATQARSVNVSRDAADANSWVQAHLRTLCATAGDLNYSGVSTYQPVNLDGSLLMLPFVVFEDAKGLRGSLARFYTGEGAAQNQTYTGDPAFWVPGMEETYGGVTYRSVIPFVSASSSTNSTCYGWGGFWTNVFGAQPGPIIFVPKA